MNTNPRDILAERFARGEITADEYRAAIQTLAETNVAPVGAVEGVEADLDTPSAKTPALKPASSDSSDVASPKNKNAPNDPSEPHLLFWAVFGAIWGTVAWAIYGRREHWGFVQPVITGSVILMAYSIFDRVRRKHVAVAVATELIKSAAKIALVVAVVLALIAWVLTNFLACHFLR